MGSNPYAGWTLKPADPAAFAGWKLTPAEQIGSSADQPEEEPGAFVRNFAQQAPLGFGNQLMAADSVVKGRLLNAAGAALSGKGVRGTVDALTAPGALDEYRQKRDELVTRQEETSAESPWAARAGKAAGIVPSLLIPGGASLRGAMAVGAGLGGANALAESKADLTKGEFEQAAIDTVIGGAGGAAGGAAGYGLGKLVQALGARLGGRAAGGMREAEADAAQAAWEKAQAALRTARSSVGGEAAAGLNAVEKAEEVVANTAGHYTPAQVAQAKAWLADPAVAALRQNAAQNVLDRGADRLAGSLQSARNVMASAAQDATPQAVEAAAQEALQSPFARQVLPRIKNYAARIIPTAIGGAVGGVPGAVIGSIAGAAMGRPGTALANMLRSPAVRRAAWSLVQSSAGALGKFGPVLQRAGVEGGVALAHALHEALLDSDPEYQHQVGMLLEQQARGQ